MSVPDYVSFESGNPRSDYLVGEWFQTTDLFGYFEKYRIKADGTIWLTPTRLVPSKDRKNEVGAAELVKVKLPEVQIMLRARIRLMGERLGLDVTFREGKMEIVEQFSSAVDEINLFVAKCKQEKS